MFRNVRIENYQKAIVFHEGKPIKLLDKGKHWFWDPFKKKKIGIYSERAPWLITEQLDIIVKSGIANEYLTIIDLKDNERALIWIDNRFESILTPGLYALWNTVKKINVEILKTNEAVFDHKEMDAILKSSNSLNMLSIFNVSEGHEGLFFFNGKLKSRLEPGRYVFWKGVGNVKLYHKDLRENVIDINGQDIMTHDNVTLRLNAVLTYKIIDTVKSVMFSEDITQTLYREAQLALRSIIGTRDLDNFLTEKDKVENELMINIKKNAEKTGIEILNFGIRDIILPGDMKDLMNKVTEAKKSAEANLITRREEVAAMRSQLNTAKLLESNPALMRIRELEVLEKIAQHSKLNVILGSEKLSEKVINLL